jgi:hypothetical protein
MLEGTLIILSVSFIDLMLVSNPMGEGLYLQSWTYYSPGFWPVQISLESGFLGFPTNLLHHVVYAGVYFLVLVIFSLSVKRVYSIGAGFIRGLKS